MSDLASIAELFQSALASAIRDASAFESVRFVDAQKAAELFDITPQGFRKLARRHLSHVDLGPRGARWSLKDLTELADKLRVNNASIQKKRS